MVRLVLRQSEAGSRRDINRVYAQRFFLFLDTSLTLGYLMREVVGEDANNGGKIMDCN